MKATVSEKQIDKLDQPSLFAMIREDIACVFERDPSARNKMEVLLTYPGIHAILTYRIGNRLWQKRWKFFARMLTYIVRAFTNIEIHPGATIGRRFFIDHGTGVVIGETAEIGNDVTLYHGVTLGGTSWSQGKRHPTLMDGVVVGAGAKILGPITIGLQAKVGANSVVIKHVPDYKTVVGIPGKIVQSSSASVKNPYGIDLNHHLISDPVAGAIRCLLDRIRNMEKEIGMNSCMPGMDVDEECVDCDALDVCESDSISKKSKKVRVVQ